MVTKMTHSMTMTCITTITIVVLLSIAYSRNKLSILVITEKRPFSFVDFLTFEVDQRHYHMSHGDDAIALFRLKNLG